VATATTGAEHEPLAFITQKAGKPRDAHDPKAVDAAVAALKTGAIHEPVAFIVQVAGKPIELQDENAFVVFMAVDTASAIVVELVHASVAVPFKYVHVPAIPFSEHAIPGDRLVKDAVMIGATHVPPEGENTHVAGNSGSVHAVPARLSALDAARD
jgi:hypothetical protein